MTVESDNTNRIERLENRVDKIEDSINRHLQRIFESLEELRVHNAENKCPAPGMCMDLGKELQHAVKSHDATMLRVERLELAILKAERIAQEESRKVERQFSKWETQKAWLLGAWSVVAFLAAIIGAVATVVIKYALDKL